MISAMTIRQTQLSSESSELLCVSSRTPSLSESVVAVDSGDVMRYYVRPSGDAASSKVPCKIFTIGTPVFAPEAEFDEFDKLIEELESNERGQKALSEGRKFVAEKFYADSETIAALRLRSGLSQAQLANACNMSQPHISRYESGRHEPSLGIAHKLSAALGVSLDRFAMAWENTRNSISSESTT